MPEAVKEPGSGYCRWVDRRAGMIGDPVAKLRYLHGAMEVPCPQKAKWPRWGAPVMVAVLLALPQTTVSEDSGGQLPVETAAIEWTPPPLPKVAAEPTLEPPSVWLVEDSSGYETYSNGLRIENRYAVGHEKRRYPVYDRRTLELVDWRSGPVGIVFHTTESHQAPFEPAHNRRLQRVGQWLLEYVQRKRAYHFVIDRFGRVHRIVRESDSADHAGYSIWADDQQVYVNLNPSFLGVSFESETEDTAAGGRINAAQVHAARVLTEMLRSRFGIPAENCVTHAQVSVFSRSMVVGNHMDWAGNFPFADLGLGDNYSRPLAAVAVFGFRYGPEFVQASSPPFWAGLALGEDEFRQAAAGAGATVGELRAERKKRYQEILEVIEETISSRETES